jgi:predicted dehydrogenase
MTTKKVNLCIVGLGIAGKIHAESVSKSNSAYLQCFVGPINKYNAQCANNYAKPLYGSIAECLEHHDIDGIIIASPNQCHLEHTRECIHHKIPFLLEKPLASSLDEGWHIVEACREFSDKVLIGHHRAHSNIIKLASFLIQSNKLGRIVSFMGSAQFFKPDIYFTTGAWRSRKGGGPILINMIHEVDSIRRLIGPIETITSISTNTNRSFEVEDTVAISFSTESDILGTFLLSDTVVSSKSWELTSAENPAYPNFSSDCYWISGTQGSLAIPTMKLQTYGANEERSWWNHIDESHISYTREDPIDLQLTHFCEVIAGQALPLVTPHDAFANMCVVDAILEASTSCQKVKVNYRT